MVCKCSSETGAGRRGLLSATRDRNKPRKKGLRNGAEGEKEGRQEEGGRNRAAQMHCVCLLTH